MIVDLPAEEAILGRDVALDVDETQHALWSGICEHQPGQAPHGVTDQMESVDAEVFKYGQGRLHQKGDVDAREITAFGFTATRRIVGDEGVTFECGLQRDVGIVFFGRTEPMQEEDGRFGTGSMDHCQIQQHAVDVQRQFFVSEASRVCHGGNSFYRGLNVGPAQPFVKYEAANPVICPAYDGKICLA
ncbi:hypothetical protein D3C72_1676160 [compost metagenome]